MAERKSRISKYEQKKAAVRIFAAVVLFFAIIGGGVYFLPQIIFGTTAVMSKFAGAKHSIGEKTVKDSIAPFAPKLGQLPKATSSKAIDITIFAEANSKITIYVNNLVIKEAKADSDGTAVFKNIPLQQGKNKLYATAADKAGNTSGKSDAKLVELKTKAPPLQANYNINNKKGQIEIVGSTDKDALVFINGRRAILKRNGGFKKSFNLEKGDNIFKIEVRDSANNLSEKEISVNYSPEE